MKSFARLLRAMKRVPASPIRKVCMVSACLLSLTAVEAAAVPDLSGAADFPVRDHLEAIEVLEQSEGPYALGLAELFDSLGRLYQRLDRHDSAVEAFQQAAHVMRVNQGLFTPLLIPLQENMLESYIASGQVKAVDDALESLVYLTEKCHGGSALALLPALKRLADWNMKLFRHLAGFEEYGELDISNPLLTREERGLEAFNRLTQAQQAFIRSIKILASREDLALKELLGLETRLIETYFYQAWREEILYDPENYLTERGLRPSERERRRQGRIASTAFEQGRAAYLRKLAYVENSPRGNARDYVKALLELGDWYQLFGSQPAARRHYREAESFLESLELSPEKIEKVLSPEVPVIIPAFTAHASALSPAGRGADEAYLEVEFSVDRNGRAQDIHILQTSRGDSSRHEGKIMHQLHNTRFRPGIAGTPAPDSSVKKIRYHVCNDC